MLKPLEFRVHKLPFKSAFCIPYVFLLLLSSIDGSVGLAIRGDWVGEVWDRCGVGCGESEGGCGFIGTVGLWGGGRRRGIGGGAYT